LHPAAPATVEKAAMKAASLTNLFYTANSEWLVATCIPAGCSA
jgi:hypothetical protein